MAAVVSPTTVLIRRRCATLYPVAVRPYGVPLVAFNPKTQSPGLRRGGFSDPVVLKLSAWETHALAAHHYRGTLVVNWLPPLSLPQLQAELAACRTHAPKRAIANHCPFPLPRRLWSYWTTTVGIPAEQPWAHLSKKQLLALAEALHQGSFAIAGQGTFKGEFVTRGGVAQGSRFQDNGQSLLGRSVPRGGNSRY